MKNQNIDKLYINKSRKPSLRKKLEGWEVGKGIVRPVATFQSFKV